VEDVQDNFKYDPFKNHDIGDLPPEFLKVRPSEGVYCEMHAYLNTDRAKEKND